MLTIVVPGIEHFNDDTQEFTTEGDFVLELEHSLVALSKWEAKHEKPFLGPDTKSSEEVLEYIECMIVTQDFPPEVFSRLSEKNYEAIDAYINAKMTATWFAAEPPSTNREVITSELIYYWLVVAQIPIECEAWHLNRLFTLLKIHSVKNAKPKKMSRAEMAQRQAALNAQRRAALGTNG